MKESQQGYMCVCVILCICMLVSESVCLCVSVCIGVYVCLHLCDLVHIYECVSQTVCVAVCVSQSLCVCLLMYTCVCVCAGMFRWTSLPPSTNGTGSPSNLGPHGLLHAFRKVPQGGRSQYKNRFTVGHPCCNWCSSPPFRNAETPLVFIGVCVNKQTLNQQWHVWK